MPLPFFPLAIPALCVYCTQTVTTYSGATMRRMWMMAAAVLAVMGCIGLADAAAGEFSSQEFAKQAELDLDFLSRQRIQLQAFQQYLQDNEALFLRQPRLRRVLTVAQKDTIRSTWQSLLDRYYALDSLRQAHEDFAELPDRPSQFLSCQCYASAFLLQYRHALEFLAIDKANPEFDIILNEPMPDQGLPANTYADFKFRFLNAAMATEFAALQARAAVYRQQGLVAPDSMDGDTKIIWQMGRGPGLAMTASNAKTVLRRGIRRAWFPVQAGISEWMGDTTVAPDRAPLITAEQRAGLKPRLRPGDILLERREWYLSNIGLPGFWPHAALYIGTPAERRAWFSDEITRKWVRSQGVSNGEFEDLLIAQHPDVYRQSLVPMADGVVRIIEAMSEGVVFTSFEHSTACDSLAVLRPRVTNPARGRAILRAFAMHGRPYDFDFDFLTDSAIVCTELVCKAYEPDGTTGPRELCFPRVEMLGRQVTPANEMVRVFDQEFGLFERQTDLVAFFDGNLAECRAVPADAEAFRASWRRPKWQIIATALTAAEDKD